MSEVPPAVRELRLVVTAEDYDEALRFYRDVLGLPERAAFSSPGGRVTILEAGRATRSYSPSSVNSVSCSEPGASHLEFTSAPASASTRVAALESSTSNATRRLNPRLPGGWSRPRGGAAYRYSPAPLGAPRAPPGPPDPSRTRRSPPAPGPAGPACSGRC